MPLFCKEDGCNKLGALNLRLSAAINFSPMRQRKENHKHLTFKNPSLMAK